MKFTVAGTFFLGTGKYYTSSSTFCTLPSTLLSKYLSTVLSTLTHVSSYT